MDKVSVDQEDIKLFVASASLPVAEFKTEFQILAGKYGIAGYDMSDEEAQSIQLAIGEGFIDAIFNA